MLSFLNKMIVNPISAVLQKRAAVVPTLRQFMIKYAQKEHVRTYGNMLPPLTEAIALKEAGNRMGNTFLTMVTAGVVYQWCAAEIRFTKQLKAIAESLDKEVEKSKQRTLLLARISKNAVDPEVGNAPNSSGKSGLFDEEWGDAPKERSGKSGFFEEEWMNAKAPSPSKA